MKNEISLARILLATGCPGSPALWAESFTFYEIIIIPLLQHSIIPFLSHITLMDSGVLRELRKRSE